MKILVISDIHGNAEALKAVLKAESDADASIFLGDALLAGPQANETARLLGDLAPELSIMGNHDREIFELPLTEETPNKWWQLSMRIIEHLDSEAISLIKDYLPPGNYDCGGLNLFLSHGDLGRPVSKATPYSPDNTFSLIDDHSECKLILFGHSHIQFARKIGDKVYVNPGSVGQPRLGKFQASYGIITDGVYEAKQVEYDREPLRRALNTSSAFEGMPEFREWWLDRLLTGWFAEKKDPWTQLAAEGFN